MGVCHYPFSPKTLSSELEKIQIETTQKNRGELIS